MGPHLASILRQMWPYRRRYGLGILALVVCDLGQLVIPHLLGLFADDLQAGRLNPAAVVRYALGIAGVAVFIAIARLGWRLAVFGAARLVEYDLRRRLFGYLEQLTPEFYHRHKTGDLMAVATNDLQAVRAAAGEGVLMSIDATVLSVATLAVMLIKVDWRLVVLGLLPLPLLALQGRTMGRAIHHRAGGVQAAFGALSDRVQETVAGIRVIKAFVQEPAALAQFEGDNRGYMARYLHLATVQALMEPLITLLSALGFFFVIGYGGNLVLAERISLGDLVAFVSYLSMLTWPMLAFGFVVNVVQRGTAGMARLEAVFAESPAVADAPDAAPLPAWRGEVEVRDLSFRYGPKLPLVLSGVSFRVQPGETLGIIGRTGSGKSTLASLLVRMWDPPPGTVFMDGRDLRTLPLADLRQHVAYVPQDAFLFSMTIAENIAFDPAPRSQAAVEQATEAAQVAQDIRGFPEGFATLLGERGITLSGGQRQRVGIARALLKAAPVLVLDDCLSAVDADTEARLLGGLRPIMAERTTLIISHRVAAVCESDQILVLDEGRIVERGTHAELMQLQGEYGRLHQLQQLEAALSSER